MANVLSDPIPAAQICTNKTIPARLIAKNAVANKRVLVVN